MTRHVNTGLDGERSVEPTSDRRHQLGGGRWIRREAAQATREVFRRAWEYL